MPLIAAVVLPDRDGPTSATAPRSPRRRRRDRRWVRVSVATSQRPKRATTNRPGVARRVKTGARSRRRAQRGRALTPRGRRRAVPTGRLVTSRSTSAPTTVATAAVTAVQAQYRPALGSRWAMGAGQAPAGSPRCPGSSGRASAAWPTVRSTDWPAAANPRAAPAHTTMITNAAAPPRVSTTASKPLSPSRCTPP
jgi:hypothetical protein